MGEHGLGLGSTAAAREDRVRVDVEDGGVFDGDESSLTITEIDPGRTKGRLRCWVRGGSGLSAQ